MTQEKRDAIMAQVKTKYPGGTVFLSAYSGNERTCSPYPSFEWDQHGDGINEKESGGYVYDRNKWAEIVSLPKQLPIFN